MTAADVPEVLAVQEPASVLGLSDVFPQDEYPFPRDAIGQRWLEEIESPGTDCFVIGAGDSVVGFAAVRGDELLHLGSRSSSGAPALPSRPTTSCSTCCAAAGSTAHGSGCSRGTLEGDGS